MKGPGGVKYAEAVGGQPDFPGSTNPSGYSGGPTGAKYDTGSSSGGSGTGQTAFTGTSSGGESSGTSQGASSGYGSGDRSSHVDAAPSYVTSATSSSSGKPKGANLTEGGFEGEARNNDFEIGSDKDPGRAALQSFENSNASNSGGGGTGPTQKEITGDNPYDTLQSEERS